MKTKRAIITQSNYIPWKGYFDAIGLCDVFVIYDEVQYTKRDWRNRNKIITPNGSKWLSIPVASKGKYLQKINETVVSDNAWRKKHWKTIQYNYKKAPHFQTYEALFEDLYLNSEEIYLSKVNYRFIKAILEILGIEVEMLWSSDFELIGDKTEKLLNICKEINATHYLSGPAAKDYLDESLFNQSNIGVEWMDYGGYPIYNQLYSTFEHGVSILDLIFNTGSEAIKYMKYNTK